MTDQEIEQEIQDKNLTAPRVTLEGIEAEITEEVLARMSRTFRLLSMDTPFVCFAKRPVRPRVG